MCALTIRPPDPPDTTPTATTPPLPTRTDLPYDYDDARWNNFQNCLIYDPPDHKATSDQFYNAYKMINAQLTNYGCLSYTPTDGTTVTPGKCLCNDVFLNDLATDIVEALPAIAEVRDRVSLGSATSLTLVLRCNSWVVDAATKALILAARTTRYVYDNAQDRFDAFEWWPNPCGGDDLVPDSLKDAFNTLNNVADGIAGWKPPKNIPKGSGQRRDKGDPDHDESGNGKDKTITVITKSNAKEVIIKSTCTAAEWPQACYHYYSAIQNYNFVPGKFTYSDDNNGNPQKGPDAWKKEHKDVSWQAFRGKTDSQNDGLVICQADEYSPAYFLPKRGIQDIKNNKGQLIRWIPAHDNQGAASIWNSFCLKKKDGGAGNGQFKDGLPNKDLLKFTGQAHVNRKGQRVTTESWEVHFTRAAFSMDFDWKGALVPNQGNNWGLKENLCWPLDIVPEDPGYVLLTDDTWYSTAESKDFINDLKASYVCSPAQDRLQKALNLRPEATRNYKRDVRADLLPLADGGLAIRGANSSRRITERERRDNIEILPCLDRFCKQELEVLGEEAANVVVVPGEPTPSLPATNVDAKPTELPKTMVTMLCH
ncbi:hypothetical protein BDV96DRAFT_594984 [Lophiotrema nucula]|uniref:Uncharacterized protein n=1 Tax=Lophiotrema nucula TaxID=690887 RepID=A0A6A5ZNU2_9PLEO|nr:hypothetical protein BDV96DRAFT_594984 [Lophiotrema nucula]